jgi:hypothetical protein
MSKSLADHPLPSTRELRLTPTEQSLLATITELLDRERVQRTSAFAALVVARLAAEGVEIPLDALRINAVSGEITDARVPEAIVPNGVEVP